MAKQTGRIGVCMRVCVCAPIVAVCKSCPLCLGTVSGSVNEVTDTVLIEFPGNTDYGTPL